MFIIGYKVKKDNNRYGEIRIMRSKRKPKDVIARLAALTGRKVVMTISGEEF